MYNSNLMDNNLGLFRDKPSGLWLVKLIIVMLVLLVAFVFFQNYLNSRINSQKTEVRQFKTIEAEPQNDLTVLYN